MLSPALEALPVHDFGSEEQRREWLPAFAGDRFVPGALAIVEPRFDADALAPATRATRADDGWRLTDLELRDSGTGVALYDTLYERGTEAYALWVTSSASNLEAKIAEWSDLLLVDIEIAMHYREIGRAANSGKLLPIAFPDSCRMRVHPLEAPSTSNRSFLLWPGEGSRPVREALRDSCPSERLTIVALDGTWSQAKTMARSLADDVPRVHLDDELRLMPGFE